MMMQKISIQLHADDIIYKPEDIAELEEYPPDQREAMVAAIMKEIGDLCKIGVEDQARCRLRLSTTEREEIKSTFSSLKKTLTIFPRYLPYSTSVFSIDFFDL